MFVLRNDTPTPNDQIVFNGTIKANSNAATPIRYMLTNPDKSMGQFAPLNVTNWSSTVDGSIAFNITPSMSGLHKLSFYLDDGTFGEGSIIGEYYFNVVEQDKTASFTIG